MVADSGKRSWGRTALGTGLLILATVSDPALLRAEEQAIQAIDLPAQPLNRSLVDLSDQTGVNFIAPDGLTSGKSAPAVKGSLSPRAAVERLLQGSGIKYLVTQSGDFILSSDGFNQVASQDESGAILLDEILVRGELQTRTIQETQSSVIVIPGEELDRRDDFNLVDVFERTPGVTSSNGERSFTLRGIDVRGISGDGNGLTVNVQVDGATLPTVASIGSGPYSLWDLEQLEVLLGPQSTQQGRNALAGAVIFRSQDPTYDFEVKGRAEAGVRDTFGGALAFNAPVIDDTLAVRFSAEHRTTDGFIDNPTLGTDDAGFDELTTVRAKMLFEPTDDLSFILSGSFSSARTGIAGALLSDLPDRRLSPADEESEEGNDTGILNLRGSWDLSDSLTLESETVGLLNDAIRLQDISGSAPTGFLRVEEETRSWSQELRLRYDSDRMAGVIGGFVTDITSRNTQSVSFPVNFILPFLPADVQLLNSFDSTTETFNFAFFGEAEIEVPEMVDGFSVIVGGRYDRETDTSNTVSSTEISRPIDLPIPLPPSSTDELEATFDAFLPKVGFVYDWTDDLSTGVTVQRGYRAGGSIRNGVTGEVSDFDPEFTWNYEFALRSQWFDQRLTANANVFYTQWRDQQVVLPGDTGIPIDVIAANAGKSRLFGGELTLEALPVPELALFGSVAVSDTKFIDFVSGPDDFTGNRFNDAPVVSAAIGGEYFFDNGIVLGADVSYTGAAFGDVDNNPENRVDGYFLVNASIGYEEENWSVELYARNLLDNEYLVSRDVDDGFGLPGEPLTVGLIGTFRF